MSGGEHEDTLVGRRVPRDSGERALRIIRALLAAEDSGSSVADSGSSVEDSGSDVVDSDEWSDEVSENSDDVGWIVSDSDTDCASGEWSPTSDGDDPDPAALVWSDELSDSEPE